MFPSPEQVLDLVERLVFPSSEQVLDLVERLVFPSSEQVLDLVDLLRLRRLAWIQRARQAPMGRIYRRGGHNGSYRPIGRICDAGHVVLDQDGKPQVLG